MSEQRPYPTQTSSTTTPAADTARHMAPETTAKVEELGDRLQHEAQRLTQQAKDQGQALFQDQKYAMAEQVSGLASALHSTAEHLRTQDQSAMAQYTQQAAEGLQRFSQTLKDRDLGSLMGQIENFARHQPGAFIGSAALLGFMAARFLKSSGERRSHPSHTPSPSTYRDTPSPSAYRPSPTTQTSPRQTTMPQTVDRPDTPRSASSSATTPTATPSTGDH
jgi:CRP-like cAMP-binding protein